MQLSKAGEIEGNRLKWNTRDLSTGFFTTEYTESTERKE